MNNNIRLITIGLALILFAAGCKKDADEKTGGKEAMLKVEVTFNGDLATQVAALTFHAEKNSSTYIDIVNDKTGQKTSAPVLSNTDFTPGETISFHSVKAINVVNIFLTIGPKISVPGPDGNFSATIKVYLDGVLKDIKTLSYDQSFSNSPDPKQWDYKIAAN